MRTLPIRPEPHPGETLASYLNRAAAQLRVSPQALLVRTGLFDDSDSRRPRYVAGWTTALTSQHLQRVSQVLRLSPSTVSGMLLSRYHGIAIDTSELRLGEEATPERRWLPYWVYSNGSPVCPQCLGESGGAWRLAWKLRWSFACTMHGRLLVDTCPSCERRPSLERGTRSTHTFAAPSILLAPAACRLPKRPLEGAAKRGRELCGHPLEAVSATSLTSWPGLLDAQRRIDQALGGTSVRVFGREVPPLTYFHNLRSLCTMLLVVGFPEDVRLSTPTFCSPRSMAPI